MKKIILAIVIVMMFGFVANAQTDGFFSGWKDCGGGYRDDGGLSAPSFGMPFTEIGSTENTTANAPLGSGMLILTTLGAAYVAIKHKKN